MKILLTGANGQVGWELQRLFPAIADVVATDRSGLDLGDEDSIRRAVRAAEPDVIFNAAAYTAVDRAEREADQAFRINAVAPGILAEEGKRCGALLVHYSTDYVFDGAKRAPYVETDTPNPLNIYGRSKLEGERAIALAGGRYLILRTSWVYGLRGRNFLRAILAKAEKGEPLSVVQDQIGAPTWCRAIAQATATLLKNSRPQGIYHLTAGGETSWYGFAREILRAAHLEVLLQPVSTAAYGAMAQRPRYSLLSNAKIRAECGISLSPWDADLAACLREYSGEWTQQDTP